jgi:outer membrane protein TolC
VLAGDASPAAGRVDPAVVQAAAPPALAPLPEKLPAPLPAPGRKAAATSGQYQTQAAVAGPAAGFFTPLVGPGEQTLGISMGDALYRAGLDNPQIAIAEQAVQASLALQLQARAMLLPSLTGGGNYHLHNGALQAPSGAIRETTEDSLYAGAGAGALAAATVGYPGVRIYAQITEAIFEPRVARQVVAATQFRARATRNNILLDVAVRYLALLHAEAELALVRQSQADFAEVVRLTSNFARAGAGNVADADRARTRALLLEADEQQAQGEVAAAAADLARYLNLDPSVRLNTGPDPIQVVQFVDPATPLPRLQEIAAASRPEVLAASAAIGAGVARVQEEKCRPFLPLLFAGWSVGSFGGGGTVTLPWFGRFGDRTDYDVMAVWTLQNGGLGNLALVRRRQAEVREAQAERVRVLNRVNNEVADGYNLSAARFAAIDVARREVRSAADAFEHDLTRIRNAQGLPVELLRSTELLLDARRRLVDALIGYDQAQFQLFVALGQPPTLVVPEEPAAVAHRP